ncbi:cytosolic phospholipase A2 gamma-like isoform X1 [Lates japonicus]|uniref:Cytosolic phospholipase A2 gamma-like isoform X1 n=1 Tax=Lates japonicus TaxID=270547 RepID=A0AAD3NNL7_LATJO|nr:cytosolic phospholipase A2 gamma-like isoform X1 [Lates japonicus]
MKQMDLRHLSDEASRNATNPYPIYSAIEKNCFSDGPIEGKWFEVSPHEAGFTEMGLFVEASLLGSKFQSGELLEVTPEMDMVRLQVNCWQAILNSSAGAVPPHVRIPVRANTSGGPDDAKNVMTSNNSQTQLRNVRLWDDGGRVCGLAVKVAWRSRRVGCSAISCLTHGGRWYSGRNLGSACVN